MAENNPELWDLPECWNHKCVPPHDPGDGTQRIRHVRQTFLSHILRSWDVGFVAQMERDLGSQEPRNIGYYSLGGRVFRPGNSTGHSLQPCSKERLPQRNCSALAGKSFSCNIVTAQLLGGGFPSESITALLCSLLARTKVFTQTSFKNFIGREESRRVAALPGWTEQVWVLYRAS